MDEEPVPPDVAAAQPAEPPTAAEEPAGPPVDGEPASEVEDAEVEDEVETAPRGDNLAAAMAVGIAVLLLICVALMLAAWHHAAPGLLNAAAWWRF